MRDTYLFWAYATLLLSILFYVLVLPGDLEKLKTPRLVFLSHTREPNREKWAARQTEIGRILATRGFGKNPRKGEIAFLPENPYSTVEAYETELSSFFEKCGHFRTPSCIEELDLRRRARFAVQHPILAAAILEAEREDASNISFGERFAYFLEEVFLCYDQGFVCNIVHDRLVESHLELLVRKRLGEIDERERKIDPLFQRELEYQFAKTPIK